MRSAVSNRDGELSFSDEPNSPVNQVVAGSESSGMVTVPCLRGDTFCRQENVQPDFMKLDVEGHEIEVLEGFGNCLEKCKIFFVEENATQEEFREAIPDFFMGPLYVDFAARRFSKEAVNHSEDAVYLNKNYLDFFNTTLGFKVVE